MGFIKRWSVDEIICQLEMCSAQMNSLRNDGFTTWGCKQDLYRVQFALEYMLKNSPSYYGEQEWLEQQQLERDRKQVWRTLNEKTSN